MLGAVEEEGTFWIQLLMIVILAAGAGVYITIKSRTKRNIRETADETIENIIQTPKSFAKSTPLPLPVSAAPSVSERPPVFGITRITAAPRRIEWPAAGETKSPRKNISSGMELLSRNFLVNIVEHTDSPDRRDIEMRCLCFNELNRRGELWSLASTALKIYTLDEDGFYGKVIRREAMVELAGRTTEKPQNIAEISNHSTANQEQTESAANHAS
jgi:hypothetical protein